MMVWGLFVILFLSLGQSTISLVSLSSWKLGNLSQLNQISAKFPFTSLKKNLLTVSIVTNALLSSSPTLAVSNNKLINLSDADIVKIVEADITERQALNSADFTRAIYDESCRFQDEIDIYPIDQYVKGTKALFNPRKSHVDLTSPVRISEKDPHNIEFDFKEDLAFNLPLIQPILTLSGKVTLQRDESTGLIVYSREQWNEPIDKILKTVHY